MPPPVSKYSSPFQAAIALGVEPSLEYSSELGTMTCSQPGEATELAPAEACEPPIAPFPLAPPSLAAPPPSVFSAGSGLEQAASPAQATHIPTREANLPTETTCMRSLVLPSFGYARSGKEFPLAANIRAERVATEWSKPIDRPGRG